MIPANVIEDIRARNDIEDVISSYVTLKRAGKNLKGLCPFHSEKTPSFVIYGDTQSFYCFGCGTGGDVISFIMRQENLDYVSAVEFLAKRVGITLPDFDSKAEKTGTSRSRVLQMNIEAAKFYRDMLFDDKIGAPARSYLINKRGLKSSVVKSFGLGYSPAGFRSLRDHLKNLGFTHEEMADAYLCGKNEKGYYDYFRDRIMFPIIDVAGNVVGFGGRALSDEVKPKYLNSSDTPAFKKSKNLFALNYAKNNASEMMIICEGYMDAIAMHAAGVTCAVATLGTAITPDHARIIKKYTDRVILSYDSDEPGQIAAERAVRILSEVGIDTRILVIEGAKDPDEFIKRYGVERFRQLLEGSRSKFDFFLSKVKKKHDLSVPEERIKASSEICTYIASVYSRVERDVYTVKAAEFLGVDKKSVAADVENTIRRSRKNEKKKSSGELIRSTAGLSDRVNPDFAKDPVEARLEEEILGMILTFPDLLSRKTDGMELTADEFKTELGRKLFTFIKENSEDSSFNIGLLSSEFSPDEVSRAVKMQIRRREVTNNESTYDDYVRAVRLQNGKQDGEISLEDLIDNKRKTKNMNIYGE